MSTPKTKFLILLLVLCPGLLFSCSGDNEENPGPGGGNGQLDDATKTYLLIEQAVSEIEHFGRVVGRNYDNIQTGNSFLVCASVEKKTIQNGFEIIYTFDPNTVCQDQHTRSGKIAISVNTNDNFIMTNAIDYVVDGTKIEGNYGLRLLPNSTTEQRSLITNGRITLQNGFWASYTATDRISNWKAGVSTLSDLTDDVIEVAADAEFTVLVKDAAPFKSKVLNTLSMKWNCDAKTRTIPVAGRVKHDLGSNRFSTTNLGNGNCNRVIVNE